MLYQELKPVNPEHSFPVCRQGGIGSCYLYEKYCSVSIYVYKCFFLYFFTIISVHT